MNLKQIISISLFVFSSNVMAQNNLPVGVANFTELTDTKTFDNEETWNNKVKAPVWSWGDTDTRYKKLNVPTINSTKSLTLKAWRGERINAQALVWSNTALEDICVTVSPMRNGKYTIPAEDISTHFVRYVMTDELNKDGRGGCGHRPDRRVWDSSIVADILDNNDVWELKARSVQPVWVTIDVPSNAKPGTYNTVLTLNSSNAKPMKLHMAVQVLNRELPAPKDWKFFLDLWQNPYSVARVYDVPLWSDAHFAAMYPTMKQLANAGQKVITATIMERPWAGQTEDAFHSMVYRMKNIDGSWTFDYTVFDKYISWMMDSVGITQQINCYSMIPWALSFAYFDQASNTTKVLKAKPGEAAYQDYWGAFLVDFSRHLREKGWFDRTMIAMDERPMDAMRKAIKVIRDADPEYKIALAGHYHEELNNDIDDYCIAFGHNYPDGVKEARAAKGKTSTVYTCCTEPKPNLFTFSDPAEGVWLGWHVAAGDYDGYLRWAYNSWTKNPLEDSRFRSFAAGDCYLVYPGGRSSIRMERLVEGIQDWEKIQILKEEYTKTKQTAKLKHLNDVVNKFTLEHLNKEGATKMVKDARKILNN
ncbi:MAG: glycoside hydrolase domain-containing protein [Marinifilaceae bacterium]